MLQGSSNYKVSLIASIRKALNCSCGEPHFRLAKLDLGVKTISSDVHEHSSSKEMQDCKYAELWLCMGVLFVTHCQASQALLDSSLM